MLSAGVDIGSLSSKAVILEDGKIRSWSVMPTGVNNAETAKEVIERAAKESGISIEDIEYFVATGLGKKEVSFADDQAVEILCSLRGARWHFPSARIVIDLGAENCRVIKSDGNGIITNFELNDKCAAGTGIFLETLAEMLKIKQEDIGELSLKSNSDLTISSTCAVYAESEVVSLIHKGVSKSDIIAAVHKSIAFRIYQMLTHIGIEREVVMTGGVAKNIGFNAELSKLLGFNILVPENPEIISALGAALIAAEKREGSSAK